MTKKTTYMISCFIILLTLILFNLIACDNEVDISTTSTTSQLTTLTTSTTNQLTTTTTIDVGTIRGTVRYNSEVTTNYCYCKIAKNDAPNNFIMSGSTVNTWTITFDNLEYGVVYYVRCDYDGVYYVDHGTGFPIAYGAYFKYEGTCLLDEPVKTQTWQLNAYMWPSK